MTPVERHVFDPVMPDLTLCGRSDVRRRFDKEPEVWFLCVECGAKVRNAQG